MNDFLKNGLNGVIYMLQIEHNLKLKEIELQRQNKLKLIEQLGKLVILKQWQRHELNLNRLKLAQIWGNKNIIFSGLFVLLCSIGTIIYKSIYFYYYHQFSIVINQLIIIYSIIRSIKPVYRYFKTLIKFYKNEKSIKKLSRAIQNL